MMRIKKTKDRKKCVIKQKFEFRDYNYCLEATHLENKIKQLEKNKFDVAHLRENHKAFIKSNKLILKLQQRLRSKKYDVVTEGVNKIALKANNNKRAQ